MVKTLPPPITTNATRVSHHIHSLSNPIPSSFILRSISDLGHASPIQEIEVSQVSPPKDLECFHDIQMDTHCESIDECMSIKRMIIVLRFYESLNIIKNNNPHSISMLINWINDSYTAHKLLDDFIHINTIHNNKLEEIQKYIVQQLEIKVCDINHCISLARHNRDRKLDRNHDTMNEGEDDQWIFIRDTFDNIHSYLFHTFDMGLKIKQQEIDKIKAKIEKTMSEDDQKYNVDCMDKYFKNITHVLQKNNKKLKSFGRFKGTKYQINATNMNKGIFVCVYLYFTLYNLDHL